MWDRLETLQTLTLELDRGQQVLVSGDGVNALPLSQIPHFTRVVATPRCYVKAAPHTHTLLFHFLKSFEVRIFWT